MKLSTKSRYGLRILLQIALDSRNESAVKGNIIAKKQDISEPYLEQIMIPLKNSDIIRTIRGCNGGYVLNKSPKDITLLEIIELFEGEFKFVNCENNKHKCSRIDFCPASKIWDDLSNVVRTEAEKITLASIVDKMKEVNKPEYVI